MRIQLLGPVEVFSEDESALPIGGPKQRTVLAALCVDPGKPVSADRLIEAVWGDDLPARATRTLATYVSALRSILGDVVGREGSGYVAGFDRSQVDATEFVDRVTASQLLEPDEAAAALRHAVGLWRGLPFSGVDGHHVLEPEITRLNELRIGAVESAVEAELESGVDVDLVELDQLVTDFPERERIRGLHVWALYVSGRQTEALASYRTYQQHLASELGLDPSPELQDLELRILQQDATLLPAVEALVDPPSLPVRYSTFVGRTDEIRSIAEKLVDHRLVTVLGPGGIGKSSLAVEAVRDPKVHASDTVVRLVVETLDDDDVAGGLAAAMGLQPGSGLDPVDVIVGYVAKRHHLILLDGCEVHRDDTAALVDRLLSATQQIRIVATTREVLDLAGESIVRLGGLNEEESTTLFVDRAELGPAPPESTLATVRELCEAVDGMPLAIELAAARTRTIPLDRIVERLDDQITLLQRRRSTDARHGSVEAALGWSYDQLGVDEKRELRWLSVFRAAFDQRDANGLLDDSSADDLVARLVDVSLIQPADESGKHRLLEPIRQYAHHLLDLSDEQRQAGAAHARWIAAEARRVAVDIWSPKAAEANRWIFDKRLDVIAALDWALEWSEPDSAVDAIAAIGRYVANQGISVSFVDRALGIVRHPNARRTGALAVAMAHTIQLLSPAERTEEMMLLIDEADAVARESGDDIALGEVMHRKAAVLLSLHGPDPEYLGQLDRAIELLDEAGAVHAKDYLYNAAIWAAALGLMREANDRITQFESWWLATTGQTSAEALGFRAGGLQMSGDMRSGVLLARQAAELHEANHAFSRALNLYQDMTMAAALLEDEELVSEGMVKARQLRKRTGRPTNVGLEIRAASVLGEHADVLAQAARWLASLRDRHFEKEDPESAATIDRALRGDAIDFPEFFKVLFPVALAFEATGTVNDACWIARQARSLMEQTQFWAFEQTGELRRWAELLERCGGGEPEGLSLEEAFLVVHDMLMK